MDNPKSKIQNLKLPALLGLLVMAGLLLAWPTARAIAIDDAFITYRYAQNLAGHGRLVYSLTGDSAFAATAPGYAVLLAGLNRLGLDIPLAGSLLGVLAIGMAALALADLLHDLPWPGRLLAAALLLVFPLPWLVLGMEGVPVMALVLLALAATRRGHPFLAALLLALATGLRFDAAAAVPAWLLLVVIAGRDRATGDPPHHLRTLAAAAGVYGLVVLAIYAALWLFLDVPLPSTLASKQAQVVLGISGFSDAVTYVTGVRQLVAAFVQQNWLHALPGILAAGTLLALLVRRLRRLAQSGSPRGGVMTPVDAITPLVFCLALWPLAHALLYVLAGVTPYLWYYLPWVPLLAALVAAGCTWLALWLGQRLALTPRATAGLLAGLALLVLIAPLLSQVAIRRQLSGELDAAAPSLATLLLPERKAGPYQAAGAWLAANTPPDATVGVTEVGIMGYTSQRPMIDFLGLLDEDVTAALRQGDVGWALYARQPDYLVLPAVNPMYSFGVYQDRWFQNTYTPLHNIPADGFWGGDLTIYQRGGSAQPAAPVSELPPDADPLHIRFGDYFELAGVAAPPSPWQPGKPAGMTLYWRVLATPPNDYTLFTHYRDGWGNIIAGRDAPPALGRRPTSTWQPGELIADFQPLGLPPLPLAPTEVVFEAGWYDANGTRLPAFGPDGVEIPGAEARFAHRALLPAAAPVVMATTAPTTTARLAVTGYTFPGGTLARGETAPLVVTTADCQGCPVELTAELWDYPGGRVVWSQTATVTEPGPVSFTVSVPPDDLAGEPELRLRATRSGLPLSWLDTAGHPLRDTLPLTPVRLVG